MTKIKQVLDSPGKKIPPVTQWPKVKVVISSERTASFDIHDAGTNTKEEKGHNFGRIAVFAGDVEGKNLPTLLAQKIPKNVLTGEVKSESHKTWVRRKPLVEIEFKTAAIKTRFSDYPEQDTYFLEIKAA